MTIVINSLFALIIISMLTNNLFPVFSYKHRKYHLIPIGLFTTSSLAGLSSQILFRNPGFSQQSHFKWLDSVNLNFDIYINNTTLIFASMVGIIVMIQFIIALTDGKSEKMASFPEEVNIHVINGYHMITLISIILLISNNLLLLFIGMIGLSGTAFYRTVYVDGNQDKHRALLTFLIADFLFLFGILISLKRFNTLNITQFAATINRPAMNWICLLLYSAILIKLIGFLFSFKVDVKSRLSGLFSIGIISLMMIVCINLSTLLSNTGNLLLLIGGILFALFTVFLSITKDDQNPSLKYLLLSQFGFFLIFLGSQLAFYQLVYVIGFAMANLLLFLSTKHINQIEMPKKSHLKSVHTWIFLFAILAVVGFIPAVGFIPRLFLVFQYFSQIQSGILPWFILSLSGLYLLGFSFASFRYGFCTMNRWRDQNPVEPKSNPIPGFFPGILLILNLYILYTLPSLLFPDASSWLSNIVPYPVMKATLLTPGLIGSLIIVTVVPFSGFVLALLSYHYKIIPASVIFSITRPFQYLAALAARILTSILDYSGKILNALSHIVYQSEEYLVKIIVKGGTELLASTAESISAVKQSLRNRQSSGLSSSKLIALFQKFAEKYEALIPLIMVVIIFIIILLSLL